MFLLAFERTFAILTRTERDLLLLLPFKDFLLLLRSKAINLSISNWSPIEKELAHISIEWVPSLKLYVYNYTTASADDQWGGRGRGHWIPFGQKACVSNMSHPPQKLPPSYYALHPLGDLGVWDLGYLWRPAALAWHMSYCTDKTENLDKKQYFIDFSKVYKNMS